MKKLSSLLLAMVFVVSFAAPCIAGTIDFEGMPQDYWYYGGQQNFGNYWDGVYFGPDSTILEKSVYGYNDSGYPPHSGDAVLFSIATPYIDAIFETPVDFFSLWYTVNTSTFYIDAYDSDDNLISTISGGVNYGSNSYLEMSLESSNIKRLRMHDSGNYFTIDDFTAPFISGLPSDAVIPEPSTFILLGSGLAGLAFAVRRRRKE